jgi:hypothetical protein
MLIHLVVMVGMLDLDMDLAVNLTHLERLEMEILAWVTAAVDLEPEVLLELVARERLDV